ncbi:CCA tRNA nucleotidyltransferase [Patescibacteria group bacterium]
MKKTTKPKIPSEVKKILETLEKAGFEAYIVGGCVRDLLLGKKPTDWDITTDAKPEEIQKLFPKSVYENAFGTVGIITKSKIISQKLIEVTPYRVESKYTDKRHPDKIQFASKLEDDLSRRDFTINALAQNLKGNITDCFEGRKALKNKEIQAVGNPEERFNEDALRLMRAVRLATQLNFNIENKTELAIKKNAGLLAFIAKERIKDEFSKLLMFTKPHEGLEKMRELGLLKMIAPEIEEGWMIGQNKHHIYTVWEHNIFALKYAADKKWDLTIRMAALLHDVGKPRSKQGQGLDSTFYGHEMIGAKMTARFLSRLRYPKKFIEKVVKLVRYHLFYYNVGEVTESSVRRLIKKVGYEDMEDLLKIRMCDRIGSNVPKAEPYKLRHLRFLIEKLARDPVSVKMLKVAGDDVMKTIGIKPGPKVGFLLNILLEDVLDDPQKNTKELLLKRIKELGAMSDQDLQKLADDAKKKWAFIEQEEIQQIKKKHWVK